MECIKAEYNTPLEFPPGYDSKGCLKLLTSAEHVSQLLTDRLESEKYSDVKKIRVNFETDKTFNRYKKKRLQRKVQIQNNCKKLRIKFCQECYKEVLFKENGWCIVEGSRNSYDWGFCDTSCAVAKVFVLILF